MHQGSTPSVCASGKPWGAAPGALDGALRDYGPMSSPDDTVRVLLELIPGPSHIGGSMHDDHGESRLFSGWLELGTLLEAARLGNTLAPTPPPHAPRQPGESS
jgi:hypothetical protein